MNPYTINEEAIKDYMRYHAIEDLKDVAKLLCISGGYLSQLLAGQRRLNEEIRLRFQMLTHKGQDQLFAPNFEAVPFTHQSFAMAKYYGVYPYSAYSPSEEMRTKDTPDLSGYQKHWRSRKWTCGKVA